VIVGIEGDFVQRYFEIGALHLLELNGGVVLCLASGALRFDVAAKRQMMRLLHVPLFKTPNA
jgi:hypothetical protein